MAEKETNCDDATGPQTHGKFLSLKRKRTKNPVASKKFKDSLERFLFNVSADELADFQKGSPQKILPEAQNRLVGILSHGKWYEMKNILRSALISLNQRTPQCCVSGCVNSSWRHASLMGLNTPLIVCICC